MKRIILISAGFWALSGCAGFDPGVAYNALTSYAPPASTSDNSPGFLKDGYSVRPDGNGGFNVYDSGGYRGQMTGTGQYDNQGTGYTPWLN